MFDFVFVLPEMSTRPIGGYKVMYEYCNQLKLRGFSVAALHIKKKPKTTTKLIRSKINHPLRHFLLYKKFRWFHLSRGIHITELWEDKILSDERLAARCYVASAWDTVLPTKLLANKYQGNGLYLIQGYEIWSTTKEELIKTFHLGLKNIAIAKWLKDIVVSTGADCTYIPNGLNFEDFRMVIPPSDKSGKLILTLFHESSLKGFDDVLKACKVIREKYPDVKFAAFGAYRDHRRIPPWMSYFFMPSTKILAKLYNNSSIYISGSYTEGWGLTSSEAMQCGCALVVSDIPGHYDWSDEGKNALLSPPGDWQSLADNVSKLLDDNTFRIRLAERGQKFIQKYTWSSAVDKFLAINSLLEKYE